MRYDRRVETLYRRPLPAEAIAFSSDEGRALFAEALAAGGLGGYFALAEQYHTQSEPAFCGLGSLVVALNALAIDPGRLWKGPWRWYSEELLDCCVSLDRVRDEGIDLDTLACLARCNHATAVVHRPDGGADGDDAVRLRAAVRDATRGPGAVLIAAYDRAALGQTGTGHYSPIGGYHPGRDLVLLLDVARFKYPPHWVPVERLAAAMRPLDPATGRPRGWVELRRRPDADGVSLSLACADGSWRDLAARLRAALTATWPPDTSLDELAAALAPLARHCVLRRTDAPEHAAAIVRAEAALRATEAHRVARAVAEEDADATAALLLLFARLRRDAPAPLGPALARLDADATADPVLSAELAQLTAQHGALTGLLDGAG